MVKLNIQMASFVYVFGVRSTRCIDIIGSRCAPAVKIQLDQAFVQFAWHYILDPTRPPSVMSVRCLLKRHHLPNKRYKDMWDKTKTYIYI